MSNIFLPSIYLDDLVIHGQSSALRVCGQYPAPNADNANPDGPIRFIVIDGGSGGGIMDVSTLFVGVMIGQESEVTVIDGGINVSMYVST